MLARRFTIVCLLVTLFGMGFAILVVDPGRTRDRYQPSGCFAGTSILCGASARR